MSVTAMENVKIPWAHTSVRVKLGIFTQGMGNNATVRIQHFKGNITYNFRAVVLIAKIYI